MDGSRHSPRLVPVCDRHVGSGRVAWRDRGWSRGTASRPLRVPADQPVIVKVPIGGVVDEAAREGVRRALGSLEGAEAWLGPDGVSVFMRFRAGSCPIDRVGRALEPLGVFAVAERCVHVDPLVVPLTVSAPAGGARRGGVADRVVGCLREHPDVGLVVLGGVLLVLGWVTHLLDGPAWLRVGMLGVSAVLTSTSTFPEAWESVRRFRVNIDVLMFAAAAGAAWLGHFEEGAFLLFLFGLGAAGEHLAVERAHHAIEALSSMAPETALVLEGEGDEPVERAVEEVGVGDRLMVRPFDRLALDGEIIEGASAIDESTITGEGVPVDKAVGDMVFAGTLNTEGRIVVRVSRPASDSTLARIMRLVSEARAGKSRAQRFTERVERWYVPLVFVATGGLIVALPLLGGVSWGDSFYRAMAFMTAASPCALAIGTPAAVLCGIARSARIGVLVKGGGYLEALARVRAVALDKTGTLTIGSPRIVSVEAAEGVTREEVLSLAAGIERDVQHPLATAIVEYAAERGVAAGSASDVTQTPGVGAAGTIDGRRIGVVKPSSVDEGAWPGGLREAMVREGEAGRTLVGVTIDGVPVGLVSLADPLRGDAREALARLRRLGLGPMIMVTGDHEGTAGVIARDAGVDEAHANLSPADKLRIVRELDREHGSIVMVGDGVNDAPALAAASVGVAMGAAGTDVALETADVALLGSSLGRLPDAIELSRASSRIIRQNLVIALVVILVVAPLGAAGVAGLALAVLLHEGSTVVVVLNSLRLLGFRPSSG